MANASKLVRMTVRNIGCIGNAGLTVELDNVVCLVGKNNAGKSTILKAYALAHGSASFSAEADRCQHSADDELSEIELEVHIPAGIANVDEKWKKVEGDLLIVRSLWRWSAPEFKSTRFTWDPVAGDWSNDGKAGGADNVFRSRLPKPVRVASLQDAESTEKELSTLAMAPLLAVIEAEKVNAESELAQALNAVAGKLESLGKAHEARFNDIADRVSSGFKGIFPNMGVKLDVVPLPMAPKISSGLRVKDGPVNTAVGQQGTGARRALFWAMLQVHNELTRSEDARNAYKKLLAKELADARKVKGKNSPDEAAVAAVQARIDAFDAGGNIPENADDPALPGYLLLIDEPENALHPMAARAAQKHLYKLAESPDWQVMMTTHSPYFINPFEDHTTIVRLEKEGNGTEVSPRTYRSDEITFQGDDKRRLQAMQHLDPSLAEIFFGSYPVLVEGDTEHAAFMSAIIEKQHDLASRVTVVRARGKAILPALISMMEHFKIDFGVLHDCDPPFREDGSNNGMWTQNEHIKNAVDKARKAGLKARHRVSVPDFERVLGYGEKSKDKPLEAYMAVSGANATATAVQALLNELVDSVQFQPFADADFQGKAYMDVLRESVLTWAKGAGQADNPRFKGK